MTIMKRFFLFFIALVFFVACNDNDESPKGEYSSGVFIVNEGNFGSADGSISFYDPASGSTKHDIFGLVNNNLALGDVVQSMTIDGDLAYIVVNNSNKVEVVNANTFVSEYRLNEVKLPRYFVVHAGKGYLTEWVSFSEQGRVAVVDLNSRTIATRITTDFGAENLVVQNNKLYVSNSFTNTVSVIDLAANAVIKTIEVGSSPGRFVVDKNNRLWVVSAVTIQITIH
jgi:YVTN family beta-propeller protein